MGRPNIVYLHSHDTGRHVAPYGQAMPTPRIQRLAEEGVLFRQAFSAAPTCSPSRAALLTGRYPHECGMLGLAHLGFGLSDYRQHLVHTLRKAGYRSTLVGVQHVADDPAKIGYDEVAAVPSRQAQHVGPRAAEVITGNPAQPFFLDIGFAETHRPFPVPSAQDRADYLSVPAPLPDLAEVRADMAGFRASARALDAGIGEVLDALDATGLSDHTLVICTTDHGLAFPHMKCNLTDHGLGVMLIMRGPKGFSGGRVLDAMVSQLDLFPTICDVADIEPPQWLRGSSLTPLLHGAEAVRDAVFAEVTYHSDYEPQRCLRTDRWKYIRRFDHRERRVPTHCDRGPSRSALEARGWDEQPRENELLFDLIFDPVEMRNLSADPRMSGLIEEMRERLAQWMRETRDPLLDGAVPAPAEFEQRRRARLASEL